MAAAHRLSVQVATSITSAFQRICTRAEVPIIRMHDLRHTAAILMPIAGNHPNVVSERLGHSNMAITLTTYSHVTAALHRDAAETLGTLLKTAATKQRHAH